MIARMWSLDDRLPRARLEVAPKRRWLTSDRLGRAVVVVLAIYLIPAVLAVLIVGGLASLFVAIASCFSGSGQGERPGHGGNA
jgi:hypothetical protein